MVLKSRNEIANGNSILLALVLLLSPAALSSFAEDVDRPVDFNRDIRPLFNAHCTACHGGVKQAADLSFVYEDAIAEVVEPGNAADSHLIERVTSSDEDERMPPPEHGRGLNEAEIELLTRWINQGANGVNIGHTKFRIGTNSRRFLIPTGFDSRSMRLFWRNSKPFRRSLLQMKIRVAGFDALRWMSSACRQRLSKMMLF